MRGLDGPGIAGDIRGPGGGATTLGDGGGVPNHVIQVITRDSDVCAERNNNNFTN